MTGAEAAALYVRRMAEISERELPMSPLDVATRRAARLEALCRCVIEVHEHVVMDTPEDRDLHDRAIATFKALLAEVAADTSSGKARS